MRGALWTSIAGGGGSYAYARMIERHNPVIERVRVPLKNLGNAFEGFRIVQISDLHVEPNFNPTLLRKTVELINGLKPDLIAITGDIITHNARAVAELTSPLAELKANTGVFASLGNHDVWTAPRRIAEALTHHGICVLTNTGVALTQDHTQLWVAGIDSAWAGDINLPAALKGRAKGAPCILLGHEPDYADEVAQRSGNLLQLAGHTHGGQVCLPGGQPLMLPTLGKKYARGLFQVGGISLYVNRGLGTIGPKARFSCSPEITEITLTNASAA